eukprot:TRINITY_DN523_c0_g1_i9.p2 TRINITY_DN523_c0_g1~~TRINITY_DN523_c0_g1_i9.p2  ORF type:complete len:103 (+),score=13.65 TRINITY_DN523_c0_g1_i9:810-1118(+)
MHDIQNMFCIANPSMKYHSNHKTHRVIVNIHHKIVSGLAGSLTTIISLQGGDLCRAMQADINYNESDIRECTKCIISAVHHLHSKGIVHRDIKVKAIFLKGK